MIEAAVVILIAGVLYLGVRLVIKFKEIASWKSDEDPGSVRRGGPLPRDLQELRIEEPASEPGSLDGIDEKDVGQL